jgi:hypothetical protein
MDDTTALLTRCNPETGTLLAHRVPISSGRSYGWVCLLLATLLVTGISASHATNMFDDTQYRLGRGLLIPNLNLTLSGYSSLRARNLNTEETRLDLRDLSLFAIWDPHPHWQIFTEIELENAFSVDNRGVNASDTEAEIERLYVDYRVDESMSVRVGRYLTPFGRWNLLHADPLVWSVSRPLVTTLAVPDHGTGIMMHGEHLVGRNHLEYHVYLDDSDDFDPHHGHAAFEDLNAPGLSNEFNNAAGVQLRYHFLDEKAEIGASFASFELNGFDDRRATFGIDALYRWQRTEISMESAYRVAKESTEGDDWGTFVQAVLPIVGDLYTVARIEFYSSDIVGRDTHRESLGLAFRPHPATTFKLEYHAGSDSVFTPDGWEASWSVLF